MFQHIQRGAMSRCNYPTIRYSDRDKALLATVFDDGQRSYKRIDDMLIDMRTPRHGWERLQKGVKYGIALAYLNEPQPKQPDADHLPVGVLNVIVADLGRAEFIVDHDRVADELSLLWERYVVASEATTGEIPVVTFRDPRFEIVGWLEREDKYFGRAVLPLPGHLCHARKSDMSGHTGANLASK